MLVCGFFCEVSSAYTLLVCLFVVSCCADGGWETKEITPYDAT